jgi:hypothetical protein
VLFEHAHDAAVHGLGREGWDLGACRCASVTALKRSTVRLAKSCSRLGPLRCVCASGAWCPGQGGHAHARAVACEHAGVLRWVVAGEAEVFSASRRGPLPQLNLHRHSAVFSRWDVDLGAWAGASNEFRANRLAVC